MADRMAEAPEAGSLSTTCYSFSQDFLNSSYSASFERMTISIWSILAVSACSFYWQAIICFWKEARSRAWALRALRYRIQDFCFWMVSWLMMDWSSYMLLTLLTWWVQMFSSREELLVLSRCRPSILSRYRPYIHNKGEQARDGIDLFCRLIQIMSQEKVPVLLTEANRSDEKALQRISDSLKGFKNETVVEATELVASEVDKLTKFSDRIKNILATINKNKKSCQETIQNLGDEEEKLKMQVAQYKKDLEANNVEKNLRNRIQTLEQEYIQSCKSRIQVAKSIDIKKLKKIEIEDRKSPANDLFKWVLSTIYAEPDSKFYWPNFKEEVFKNDKGSDFKQRLGKVSSRSTKEEQRVRTEHFIDNYPDISRAPELAKVKEEADKIYKSATEFRKGYKIAAEIADCEQRIEKNKEQTLDRDQQNLRSEARINALQGRIDVNRTFLALLQSTESSLQSKVDLYLEKSKEGKALVDEMESLSKWEPRINTSPDSQPICSDCRMF